MVSTRVYDIIIGFIYYIAHSHILAHTLKHDNKKTNCPPLMAYTNSEMCFMVLLPKQ